MTHEFGPIVLDCATICLPRATGGLAVDHVSLAVRAGEIFGTYGLMGAGRSELLECIIGRHGQSSGAIRIGDKWVAGQDTAARIAAGLALIPEDRQRDDLVSILSIASNLTLPSLRRLAMAFHIRPRSEAEEVRGFVTGLSIKAPHTEFEVSLLSGGNQQKVVIGKALMTRPRVLLMDEPSRGIGVGAKADVFRTMRELAAGGIAIVLVTSDRDEVVALSDRIGVKSNGRMVAVHERKEITETEIVAASMIGNKKTKAA